jgi:ParB family chromosome partitioning protein
MDSLFPVEATYVERYPLANLPTDYPTVPPSPTMIASVRSFGLIQPIVLAGNRLVAGRRRIDAARKVGHTTVRAIVFPTNWSDESILALVENTQRKSNPINELHHIELLLSKNYTYEKIRQESGMTKQALDKLLVIRNKLIKPLRRALTDNVISFSTAYACAKKSFDVQNKLLNLLEEEGELTHKDVELACKVVKKEAVAALPSSLFDNGGDNFGWQVRFSELISEAKEIAATGGSARLQQLLDQVIKEI